jgi:hypothetical protein
MIQNLPEDIIHNIIEFDGRMKYRNGEFMVQIPKTDERYKMLLDVQKKIQKTIYVYDVFTYLETNTVTFLNGHVLIFRFHVSKFAYLLSRTLIYEYNNSVTLSYSGSIFYGGAVEWSDVTTFYK